MLYTTANHLNRDSKYCSETFGMRRSSAPGRANDSHSIIRILFMIPIYTLTSFLCIYFYKWTVYFELIGYCYEPFAIASFFTLLCSYIAPELHDQKEFFRQVEPINWVWPIPWLQKCTGGQNGLWRKPRSGLTWFNVCGPPFERSSIESRGHTS